MRTARATAAATAALLLLSACGGDDEDTAGPADDGGSAASSDIEPGIVTDIGGLGDRGFNDLAQAGLESAQEELGVEGRVLVPETPADFTNNLSQFAQSGAAPVFGIGFSFADAMSEVSQQFPDTHFAIVDSVVDEPNVASLVFREEEGSYLAGVVAGLMTQEQTDYTNPEKVVGFVGGQESPLIEKFGAGFQAGVLSVCSDCEVLYQYVGTTTQAFSDPGTASEIARDMHANGADVIYHAAGASGDGVFNVATEENFFAIGVNVDQATTNPDAPILTSVLKRVDEAVASTIAAEADGTFEAGVQSFGLADGGISLAPFGEFESVVPEEVQQAVDDAAAGIEDGSLTVPTTLDEVGAS